MHTFSTLWGPLKQWQIIWIVPDQPAMRAMLPTPLSVVHQRNTFPTAISSNLTPRHQSPLTLRKDSTLPQVSQLNGPATHLSLGPTCMHHRHTIPSRTTRRHTRNSPWRLQPTDICNRSIHRMSMVTPVTTVWSTRSLLVGLHALRQHLSRMHHRRRLRMPIKACIHMALQLVLTAKRRTHRRHQCNPRIRTLAPPRLR